MSQGPPPPAIALDATLWDAPTTGIGLYTRSLAAALERLGVQVQRFGAERSGNAPRGAMGKTAFVLRRLPALLAQTDAPLFHAVCNFNLPLRRVPGKKLVLTVHDLIPDLLPGSVSLAYRWQFRLWLRRSLALADAVICDSAKTRDDLLERFGPAPEKVSVVHLGADHVHQIAEPAAADRLVLERLPDRFLLYAGALDARKNVRLVLDALQHLRRQKVRVPLVLAGQRWFGAGAVEARVEQMRREGFDIRPLGYLPAEAFYAVMKRAAVFVFPSRYEGFGLPPLEAMALGVASVVSTTGSLPEVCGDGALLVQPDDAHGLAAVLGRLLSSAEERSTLAARGRLRAAQLTWEKTARETLQVYRSVLGLELRLGQDFPERVGR